MGELLLLVRSTNTAALRLYEKMGYSRLPRKLEHSGEICLRRRLFTPTPHSLKSILPQHTLVENM